ncbi:MAG: PTS sugar transporter subunit IIA [Chlamydiales bacterium]|nr:PTS sugar transporter subunit IIA [Chlamydiales bacterium]
MVDISKYLDTALVCFLDVATRDEALRAMVERVQATGRLEDPEAFYQAIISREEIVTTGIGMGVAIPHAKLSSYNQFFICIAVLKRGVDWKALDSAPVRLIFMIGGPDDRQTEYLQILSGLTSALRDEERRKKMLTADTPQAVLDLLIKR